MPVLPTKWPPWLGWPLAAAVTASLVAAMRPLWRAAVTSGSRRAYLLSARGNHLPSNATERVLWGLVSRCGGIGEEITYRGVLFGVLWRLSGSVPLAALGSAIVFTVSHWMQGPKSMVIIFGFALQFQALALLTGSLAIGITVHVAYDLLAGLHYARYGRVLGYQPAEHRPTASA